MLTKQQLKDTLFLRAFGLFKVPLLFATRPSVLSLNPNKVEVRIPLRRFVSNHLGSMYFGALAVGADCAAGILAVKLLHESKVKATFVFKDLKAEFLKRADGDVHFVSTSGALVEDLIKRVASSTERHEAAIDVVAYVPKKYGEDPVAKFVLTLSMKRLVAKDS